MTKLKNFTTDDMFTFQGSEHFPDGSVPRIHYFTDEEMESFFNLMGLEFDSADMIYLIHHAEGISLGWCANGEPEEVNWPSGEVSEQIERLLESFDSHTLPLWAMSVAKVQQ